MECVDQRPELFRRAETAGRRIKAGRLVAPGAVERMLGHRQKLDMGEAHLLDIGHETLRHLAVAEEAVSFLRHAHPRSEMDLVYGDRSLACGCSSAMFCPAVVAPEIGRASCRERVCQSV